MMRHFGWIRLVTCCALLVVIATGCYQNVNDAANTNAIAMDLTATATLELPTTEPTLEPTATPEFDVTATETPTVTPTETPTLFEVQAVETTPADLLMSDTGGAFDATPTAFIVAQAEDVFSLTATAFVAQVTQTQEASFTQTAIALGLGATFTPFPTFTPEFAQTLVIQPTTGFAAPAGTVCIHEVQLGDNLFRLSQTYGVTVTNLAAANGITNIQLILVGQMITIPNCGTTGVFPPPTSTATFVAGTVAGTGGFGTPDPGTGGGVATTNTICNQHIIQEGQTLFQISQTYGVSVSRIAAANGIGNINVITMTETLQIPCP
jgi:LysM repeat protein